MGLISISVFVASVVYVLVRPPPWMPLWFVQWRRGHLPTIASDITSSPAEPEIRLDDTVDSNDSEGESSLAKNEETTSNPKSSTKPTLRSDAAALMPPPALPTISKPPTLIEPVDDTTPKSKPSTPSISVPTFSLDDGTSSSSTSTMPAPALSMPPPPRPSTTTSSPSSKPAGGRIPSLPQFPATNSIQRARGPVPSRGPPNASSGLTPPPTITTKPQKPSRKVLLEPGHSPLDWASISGPNADLRGVPPETPYLRVTPSMLKEKTGRKGKDAWMAINGKVYNVTPYAKFHPGGIPELMRGAGRDGTKLFWEIHPWVNYDTMLAACLVGLMVDEPEGSGPSKMDEMD